MMPLHPNVIALFTAPFKADSVRVSDGTGREVCRTESGLPIASGFERHPPASKVHLVAWLVWFCVSVPETSTLDEVAAILNDAWKSEP